MIDVYLYQVVLKDNDMNILFIGKVKFSLSILEEIINNKITINNVITSANKGINSDHEDLSSFCKKKKIQFLDTDNINSIKTINWIKKSKPDLILCIGWSQILSKQILKIPNKFVIGYHPTNLPKNRGRHPLIWSIALGLENMTSTFFQITEKVDYGNILSKKIVKITKTDDAESMYFKLQEVSKKQIIEIIKKIQKNKLNPITIKSKNSNIWRRRYEEDGKIDWRMSSKSIYNLVRALSKPYDGAHFVRNKKKYKLFKCKVISLNQNNIEPGKVIIIKNNNPIIKCGNGSIECIEIIPKIKLNTGEYL